VAGGAALTVAAVAGTAYLLANARTGNEHMGSHPAIHQEIQSAYPLAREFAPSFGTMSQTAGHEMTQWEKSSSLGWTENLTPNERDGFVEYLNAGSIMNYVARQPHHVATETTGYKELVDRVIQKVPHIDSAIAKASIPEDIIGYRGISSIRALGIDPDELPRMIGSKLRDAGFMSMSLDKNVSDKLFSGGTQPAVFRVRIPRGAAVASMVGALSGDEDMSRRTAGAEIQHEMLAGRGHGLKILAVKRREAGGFLIEADLVAPGDTS
jgi:hypothetical protein